MKTPITTSLGLAVLVGIFFVTPALAVVNIDFVTVGDAENAADSTGYDAGDACFPSLVQKLGVNRNENIEH